MMMKQRDYYEEWKLGGKKRLDQKAADMVSRRLAEYEKPDIDPSIEKDLVAYIKKRVGR
jgi:trimethylamine--corrinoid protein Co-methyltransferase